jgi:hypothetical protein
VSPDIGTVQVREWCPTIITAQAELVQLRLPSRSETLTELFEHRSDLNHQQSKGARTPGGACSIYVAHTAQPRMASLAACASSERCQSTLPLYGATTATFEEKASDERRMQQHHDRRKHHFGSGVMEFMPVRCVMRNTRLECSGD